MGAEEIRILVLMPTLLQRGRRVLPGLHFQLLYFGSKCKERRLLFFYYAAFLFSLFIIFEKFGRRLIINATSRQVMILSTKFPVTHAINLEANTLSPPGR